MNRMVRLRRNSVDWRMFLTNAHHLDRFARLRTETAHEAAVSQTGPLMEALVAAYALMAHADGEVAGAERRRLFAILRDNPLLSMFSREDVAEEAAVHEANFRLDPELAQQIAREKLQPVIGQGRATRLVIAACREIIPADGVAHPAEYRALASIKAILGVEDATGPFGPATTRPTRDWESVRR